jgi:hypothetical protein
MEIQTVSSQEKSPVKSRTVLQREASRRNGRKSKDRKRRKARRAPAAMLAGTV